MALTGKNISLPIYHRVNGVQMPFHNLVLRKFVVDSVVMSLGDKITGDVYYRGSNLQCTMKEYVVFNGIEYTLVNPPTLVREGLVSDNSDLKGMAKYSFEFYHPMYILGNLPFSDVAVSYDELRYKSQDKTFSWIGKPADYVAKLNKNLEGTQWVVVLSNRLLQDKLDELSEVLSFDKETIADALKKCYETWGLSYIVDALHEGEYFNEHNKDYYSQDGGNKRFVVTIGLPTEEIIDPDSENGITVTTTTLTNEIAQIYYYPNPVVVPKGKKIVLESLTDGVTPIILNSTQGGVIGTTNRTFEEDTTIYIASFKGTGNIRYFFDGEITNFYLFQFGQGLGLKNNSRTPRNNKIVTRISGYGSENNIPYGYPQIPWYGDQDWDYTINNTSGMQEITVNGQTITAMSYPIYKGIVGGQYVKLIKHPFARTHLMPSVYAETLFNKVSQYNEDGTENTNFNPNIEIVDYYDAVSDSDYGYPNEINLASPSYEIHEFDDIKPELGEEHILGVTPINADLTDADGWDDTIDDDGNFVQSYFKITLPQLEFDIYACAAITEEMKINMRSGACIGCTFTVQVDWDDYKRNFYDSDMNFVPNGEQRDYTKYPDSSQGSISVIVQKENSTFGTIMPNIYQHPKGRVVENGQITYVGDAFVVLGISLPLSYITNAQERLDDAMKSYMLKNNIYYYDYPLKLDEYFLANKVQILNQIKPNSIIRFQFNDEQLELFVKQFTIKFNEGVLPQYDITLTDNVEITLNQIGQVVDDVEHLGTLFANFRKQYNSDAWLELAKKLSKVSDDTAQGLITFAKGWETQNFFSNNFFGYGAKVNERGVGEFEELNVRGAIRAAELIFNKISAEEGESIRSIGHGEILTVTQTSDTTGTATLKLDGDEWASIEVGDICRGLYNTLGNSDLYENYDQDGEDDNGFRLKKGFFASYFKVTEVTSSKGECTFSYELQTKNGEPVTEHPCPLMKFAVYGNTDNNKKERQSSMYITAVGISPRLLYLANVNTWKIDPSNIKVALGNLENLKVYEQLYDGSIQEKTLHGDAGLFVEDNIYFGGILNQFTAADWEYIQNQLGQGIHAQLLRGSDNIIIDASGNVVGGLYVESTDGTTTTRVYKLHTGVLVYDSGKKRYLTLGTEEELADGEFAMYVTANGCTVLQDGADVYVTAIDNTANGNTLTDAQLAQMRDTNEFSIDFVIVTASGWRTQMTYPVKITHLDYSYITFDLTNEVDSMAYRTQMKEYDGLPIHTDLKAYANGVELDDDAYISTTVESDAFVGDLVCSGDREVSAFFGNDSGSGLKCTAERNGIFTITKIGDRNIDLPDSKYYFDIHVVVKYLGVQYTSPAKRFTLTETTDATLYKLLLSANAISKDEGTYTPNSIDVKLQIIDSTGTNVYTDSYLNANSHINVWYLNGVYDPSMSVATLINAKTTTQPNFDNNLTCLTVLAVDNSDTSNPVVLDVESVTVNAVGRDGAGQPWVYTNLDQIVIDCDSEGNALQGVDVTLVSELYWGEQRCTLDTNSCSITKNSNIGTLSTSFAQGVTANSTFQITPQSQAGVVVLPQIKSFRITIYLVGTDANNETHTATKTIAVIANIQGATGAAGAPGAMLRYRKDYSVDIDTSEDGYVWNEIFRDCVKHESSYWFVNVPAEGNTPLGTPDENNNKWMQVNSLNIVATELLLAENAVIDLLYSNVIKIRDSLGNLTATINEDQHGSYCIYYPSGNKLMEFRYDGFIVFYNNNEENTEKWRLGHGGLIEEGDGWAILNYAYLGTELPNSYSTYKPFELLEYYKFMAGYDSNYTSNDGEIHKSKNLSSDLLEDGYYTINAFAVHYRGNVYKITVYLVREGRIVAEGILYYDGEGTYYSGQTLDD